MTAPNWRCRILGHAGPRWLDYQHQGHCPRCREPHPEWIKQREDETALRTIVGYGERGWSVGVLGVDFDSITLPDGTTLDEEAAARYGREIADQAAAPRTPVEERCWWSMSGDAFIEALRQAHAGEDPELVYAEWYANGVVESP